MSYSFKILLLCCILHQHVINADFSIKKVYSLVAPEKFEKTEYQELDLGTAHSIIIKNTHGATTVRSEKSLNSIYLKAIKKSSLEEVVPLLTYRSYLQGTEIIIESNYDCGVILGSIDYELIIPASLCLQVENDQGSIIVKQPKKHCILKTVHGSITVYDAQSVNATCCNKGSITVYNADQKISATTAHGAIYLYNAHDAIVAQTQTGKIDLVFPHPIASTAHITARSSSGLVTLCAPKSTNAELIATTERGSVLSDHFITLKPVSMQLNKQAWKQLQKKIEGTIGDHKEKATICLHSARNNIKVLETKIRSAVSPAHNHQHS